jgi:DedD protein
VVLLLIGVVGFPVLFETQPRPLPIDTPIEAPRRDTVASGLTGKDVAAPKAQPLPVLPADAGVEEAPAPAVSASAAASRVATVVLGAKPLVASAPASASAAMVAPAPALASAPTSSSPSAPAPAKASAPPPKPVPPPAAKPTVAPAAAPAALPAALPEKPLAAAAAASVEAGRYVVQAGAYSEAGKLREARAKIEKLGLKTYTQVVESDKGSRTRVRVGPYATRAEAEAVADKVKRSGVPAAIIAL